MAANYPGSRITAVSNSRTQKLHIDARRRARDLANLEVITCDVNQLAFPAGTRFDRVVSVEMFEHMRNYDTLLARVASWMAPARHIVRTHLHALASTPIRSRFATRATGWRGISSPAASCRATICCCISSATCGCSSIGRCRAGTTSSPARPGSRTWTGIGPSSCRCWRAPTASPGAALVGVLARVLHVLRGAVGIRRRPRMAGIALPV